ncbi:MAG: VWA domain-containing protein [Candidatus Omnitrophota bacterium]
MELRLADKLWLLLLAVIPFVVWAMFRLEKRFSAAFLFPRMNIVNGLPVKPGPGPLAVSRVLKIMILVLVVIAIARPQWVKSKVKIFSEGIDIAVALDISTSMNAADFQPLDRISVAKDVVGEFITSRKNDRIGLVVFAKEAYTQSPLTIDYKAVGDVVQTLKTGSIEDGTAIGNAIAVAANRLRSAVGKSKVIILLTDGDNNAGNISPLEAAELVKQHGIRIFTILVGREGPVPYPVGKDMFGRVVYQNVEFSANPTLLREIAEKTGGKFYTAEDGAKLREDLQKVLDDMEKTMFAEASTREDLEELAPYLLLAALALLLADFILVLTSARRYPW